jgi:hypothetical protein
MNRLRVIVPAAAVLATACASGGQTSGRSVGNRNVITAEELASLGGLGDVYDAIQRLRSTWFRTRSGTTAPVVVVDNVRAGDLEMLRSISTQNVQQLRYISPSDATTRWGTGYTGGAIEVIMRR